MERGQEEGNLASKDSKRSATAPEHHAQEGARFTTLKVVRERMRTKKVNMRIFAIGAPPTRVVPGKGAP